MGRKHIISVWKIRWIRPDWAVSVHHCMLAALLWPQSLLVAAIRVILFVTVASCEGTSRVLWLTTLDSGQAQFFIFSTVPGWFRNTTFRTRHTVLVPLPSALTFRNESIHRIHWCTWAYSEKASISLLVLIKVLSRIKESLREFLARIHTS